MNIQKSDEVKTLLESRNIRDEELIEVIQHGENTGQKFYHPETGRCLAYKRLGEATYYIVYSVKESQYTVDSAYWHKSELS